MGERLPLRIVFVDRRKLWTGGELVLLAFIMPAVITIHDFRILHSLNLALIRDEQTELIVAALKLVSLNSLRGVPHYIGAFLIGESITFRWKGSKAWWVNAMTSILVIYFTYLGIGLIHGIRYDFGLPAVLASGAVIVFGKMHYQYIASPKKIVQIILVFVALQFLDVMPMFNGLPVGRGETSSDVKLAAAIIDGEMMLNSMGAVCLTLFMLFAALIFYQLREENQLRELGQLREQNQAITLQNEINEMENRIYQEMRYLVHDLKSPLTSVQTLVGVIKIESEEEQAEERIKYLTRIEKNIERMSEMISEVLYTSQRNVVTTETVLSTALAQMSVTDYAQFIRTDNRAPQALVCVNRFLFPRVLVNLAQNSAQALSGESGVIRVVVDRQEREDGGWVAFTVSDDGCGIREEEQPFIWEHGVSLHNSSGVGLAFVRQVVENAGGQVTLKSVLNEGTTVTVWLPEIGDTE